MKRRLALLSCVALWLSLEGVPTGNGISSPRCVVVKCVAVRGPMLARREVDARLAYFIINVLKPVPYSLLVIKLDREVL